MLRAEEYRKRKWGNYPALRRIIEGKKLPQKYYGSLSISDNLFSKIDRLIEITLLVKENESRILESLNKKGLAEDISKLEDELIELKEFVSNQLDSLNQINDQLEK